jgi:methylase of polypeptide subunit release factors
MILLYYRFSDKVIELGVGSGFIISKVRCDFPVGTDIDIDSLYYARINLNDNIELVLCDSAEPFRDDSFDVAFFNPPYLPGKIEDDPKVIGGEDGATIPSRMLNSALRVVKNYGIIFFVLSSYTSRTKVFDESMLKGKVQIISKVKLFFETLYVYMVQVRK